MKEPTLMSGCSIHMLPQIEVQTSRLATGNTNESRRMPMSSASERSSMPPSHPLSSQPPEVWPMKPPSFTSD